MSAESQSPPQPHEEDTERDVVLWRKKKASIAVLLVATATWVLLQVYDFNFMTAASWLAMFLVTSTFLWANILRLFSKEPSHLSGLEIPEQSAVEMTYVIRSWMEAGVRWMFRVGAEGHLLVFAGTIAALWVTSRLAGYFDLLTLLYIGIISSMTMPSIYVKYEDKIKGLGERLRIQCKRSYSWIDDKLLRKIKNKVAGGDKKEEKEKKIE